MHFIENGFTVSTVRTKAAPYCVTKLSPVTCMKMLTPMVMSVRCMWLPRKISRKLPSSVVMSIVSHS